MKILALTRYEDLAASTRYRFLQYDSALRAAGMEVTYAPLFDNDYLGRFVRGEPKRWRPVVTAYLRRSLDLVRARKFDVIWVYWELFPFLPLEWLSKFIGTPIVVDYDDAVFHRYDASDSRLVSAILGNKLAPLLKAADACCCGNPYLRDYTARFCPNSIVLPTVVDTDLYLPRSAASSNPVPIIGWIGSPTTWWVMRPLLPMLKRLVKEGRARVRIIGAGVAAKNDPTEGLELVDWTQQDEIKEVQSFDIGIMPLIDSPFERGKSGFKLIQYMACGLPTIATPVGVNSDIVEHGKTGFLATTEEQWKQAVDTLLDDPELRRRMGEQGRARAVADYSLAANAPKLIKVFQAVAGKPMAS